jgi:NADH:ubiquinone oxidoreductase subunit 5 (subunit L)/multisubunit Na+/H+ antiporter MnhA subunit
MNDDTLLTILGLAIVVAPALLFVILGLPTLIGHPLSEKMIGRATQSSNLIGLSSAVTCLALMITKGIWQFPIDVGQWVTIHEYHFSVAFILDTLSLPFVILSFVLCGTVGSFARVYMHRERGFNRFFVFYAMFLLGMTVTSLAGTIETLFTGWELVGLSSALLVAFYFERPETVRNGLRIWSIYRISDASLLLASLAMHHLTGEGDFHKLLGDGPWPLGRAMLTQDQAFFVGLLLLIAVAGKSALVPFSGWLPRAMEGPTPSSAVFYGALSVHLGAFLLLRVSTILDLSVSLRIAVVSIGLVSAVYAAFVARVQTDIKSALALASLTQVGIIVAEIGLGFRYLALLHIIGHGCLRTLQFVRAPSLLIDYRVLENAIGGNLSHRPASWHRFVGTKSRTWLYRLAMDRGFLDVILSDWIANPFLAAFRQLDQWERRWFHFVDGDAPGCSENGIHPSRPLEELI